MVKEKFENLSRKIWLNIPLAQELKILYGEETITDLILLELAKEKYSNISIIQTPKRDEAKQGTDWEWYVGSDSSGWIRYAIQAKKLNPISFTYKGLNHTVGTGAKQIEILKKYASSNDAIPIYTFYN